MQLGFGWKDLELGFGLALRFLEMKMGGLGVTGWVRLGVRVFFLLGMQIGEMFGIFGNRFFKRFLDVGSPQGERF